MTPEEVKVLKRKRVLKSQLIELTNKEIEELDRLIEEGERDIICRLEWLVKWFLND